MTTSQHVLYILKQIDLKQLSKQDIKEFDQLKRKLVSYEKHALTARMARYQRIMLRDPLKALLTVSPVLVGKKRAFEYAVKFGGPGKDMRYQFVEELWAVRRVGFLLDQIQLNGQSKEVVDELVPSKLSLGELQKVLMYLLKEKVSIRNLALIMELLSDNITKTKDPEILTEFVRDGLARQICDQYKDKEGNIAVITLDPKLEQLLEVSIQQSDKGNQLVLRPEVANRIIEAAGRVASQVMEKNEQPVVLASPLVRAQFKKLLESAYPYISILSYNEIIRGVSIKSIGTIKVEEHED